MDQEHDKMTGRFCDKPFRHFEVDDAGGVYSCCPGWLPKPIGNLADSNLVEVWNSEDAQAIRRSIHDGSFRYCQTTECPFIQTGSLPLKEDIKDPELQNIIQHEATILDKKPAILNLAYDRTCNLFCPSCRLSKIMIKGKEYRAKLALQERLLQTCLDDAELLVVTGSGDPFASKLYNELLATIDAAKYPRLRIHLMTNAVLFTPKAWRRWSKAHAAMKTIQISIDATSEHTYQQVRCGGDFARLLTNLSFVRALRESGVFDVVSLEFVVQAVNFREMGDFVMLGKSFGFDRVGFARLRNWGTFTDAEYTARAVHLPVHPEHQEFLRLLRDPIFRDPIVSVGNLTDLLADTDFST